MEASHGQCKNLHLKEREKRKKGLRVLPPMTPLLILSLLVLSCTFLPRSTRGIYPEDCKIQEDCGLDEICQDDQCICDIDNDLEYDDERGKCVKLAGTKCQLGAGGANKDTSHPDHLHYECVENAVCSVATGICECLPGLEITQFEECKKGFGAPCSNSEECNVGGFLICDKQSGACACQSSNTSLYDPTQGTCVSVLGAECELQTWMGLRKGCVPNGVCSREESHKYSNYIGICNCLPGFTNLSLSECIKLEGDPCEVHSECVTRHCSSGKCACPGSSPSFFDLQRLQCVSRVGGLCEEDIHCPENAFCQLITSADGVVISACQCDSLFRVTSLGRCEAAEIKSSYRSSSTRSSPLGGAYRGSPKKATWIHFHLSHVLLLIGTSYVIVPHLL